jgi:hypothetical protein
LAGLTAHQPLPSICFGNEHFPSGVKADLRAIRLRLSSTDFVPSILLGNMNEEHPLSARPGFVLALIVALGLILFAWMSPYYAGSTKAKLPQITSNLKQIGLAKELWASDHGATAGVQVSEQDLATYLRPPKGATGLVMSVLSETYRLNPIGTPPEAQLEKAIGKFPKGMVMRWSTNKGCEIRLPNPQSGTNGWHSLYPGRPRTPRAAAPRGSP